MTEPTHTQPATGGITDEERARLEAAVEQMKSAEAAADSAERAPRPIAETVRQTAERVRANLRLVKPDELPPPPEDRDVWDSVDEHQARIRRRAWLGSLREAHHEDLAHWTLDMLDADQHRDALRRFVDQFAPGRARDGSTTLNLVLAGPVGTGKSVAAIAIGNAAAGHGLMVRFVKHATYVSWLMRDGHPGGLPVWQVRDRFRRADLLVLDDVGADLADMDEAASRFVRQETSDLISDRLTDGRPTVYTTNEHSEGLERILGNRATSRMGQRAYAFHFTGTDRRRPITW